MPGPRVGCWAPLRGASILLSTAKTGTAAAGPPLALGP